VYAIVPSNASWGNDRTREKRNRGQDTEIYASLTVSCFLLPVPYPPLPHVDSGPFGLKIATTQQAGNLGKGRR